MPFSEEDARRIVALNQTRMLYQISGWFGYLEAMPALVDGPGGTGQVGFAVRWNGRQLGTATSFEAAVAWLATYRTGDAAWDAQPEAPGFQRVPEWGRWRGESLEESRGCCAERKPAP